MENKYKEIIDRLSKEGNEERDRILSEMRGMSDRTELCILLEDLRKVNIILHVLDYIEKEAESNEN